MEKKFDNWLKELARIAVEERRALNLNDFLKVMKEANDISLLKQWKNYVFNEGKEIFKKYLKQFLIKN